MNENNLLREIGRSFIVSSFVPAALFISVASLLFWDFYPYFLKIRMPSTDLLYAGQWIFVVMFVFWTGFGLYSSWNWTVRLYEGYLFPSFIADPMREQLVNEKERNMNRIKAYLAHRERLANLSDDQREIEINSDSFSQHNMKLQLEAVEEYQKLELFYPKEREQFLPTRLGNILRASERYSWDRYRLEGVTFFSRLVHLLPSSFTAQLEEQNNKFIFLLNSSFLSLVIGLICTIIVLIRLPCYAFPESFILGSSVFQYICTVGTPNNFFQSGFSIISEWKYFVIGLGFLLGSYVLYRVALIAANAYARLIRTSFDLYRFELLKKFSIALPESLIDEQNTWRMLSQFIISETEFSEISIDYEHSHEKKDLQQTEQQKTVTLNVKPLLVDINMRKKKRRLSNQLGD